MDSEQERDVRGNLTVRSRATVLLSVLVASVLLDQGTKLVARATLAHRAPRWYLGGIVCLELAENSGAFMGMGANLAPLVRLLLWVVLVGVILVFTIVYVVRTEDLSRWQVACLSLVVSGGVGNLIDRVFNDGAVVDWVSVGIGSLRTGVLNIADVAVTGGCVLFVLLSLRRERGDDRT